MLFVPQYLHHINIHRRYLDEAVPTPTSINTVNATRDSGDDSGGEDSREEHDTSNDNDSDYAHSDTDHPDKARTARIKNCNAMKSTGGRSALQQKFYKMSSALCEVVDDYGLVSFHPMNIEDVEVTY